MNKKMKQYSAEEKTKIILDVLSSKMTMAQICSKYKIHANQIYSWKKEALDHMITGFKSRLKKPDTGHCPYNIKK